MIFFPTMGRHREPERKPGKDRRCAIWPLLGLAVLAPLGACLAPNGSLGTAETSPPASLTFAVIGDYGVCGARSVFILTCPAEKGVATLVRSWNPTAIFTTGDNSYDSGSAEEIPGDQEPYADYISSSRFFPSFGNHDWGTGTLQPSLSYFRLSSPYYQKQFANLLSVYLLDTNPRDPAGDGENSEQASWLRTQVAASSTPWNVAFNHQAPYASCGHGSSPAYRWVAAPGIDIVFSGHNHAYERLVEPNHANTASIPYVVIGASGAPLNPACSDVLPGQQKAIYGRFGAVKLVVTATTLTGTFYDIDGAAQDSFVLTKPVAQARRAEQLALTMATATEKLFTF